MRIMRAAAVLLAAWLVALAAPAAASGDFGCAPRWKLLQADFTGCDSMAMLSPGNDTRVNLALLLAGPVAPPTPVQGDGLPDLPQFDWTAFRGALSPAPQDLGSASHAAGEGSRCRSDTAGRGAFAVAVRAARGLRGEERDALVAARQALKPGCVDGAAASPAAAPPAVRSRTARDFASYLVGAAAFYAGDFDAAATSFAAIARADQPWLRETARYMLARVEVNRAQVGAFDEYGYRDAKVPVDPATIATAEARLRDYLRDYPDGRYAASARGLLRRVYWLGGDTARLAAEYAALFRQPPAARGIDTVALTEEIDDKLMPRLTATDTSDPVLLAVLNLRAMRRAGDGVRPLLTRAELEAQRARFSGAPALFDTLLAIHALYVDGDAPAVLRLLPAPEGAGSIAFTQAMLRGMAAEATRDPATRAGWLALLRTGSSPIERRTVELALAMHDERNGGLARVFAPGSPVTDRALRDRLLVHVADAALLRQRVADPSASAHERAVALFTLLYKGLTRGGYRGFVADLAVLPAASANEGGVGDFVGTADPPLGLFAAPRVAEDFACPTLHETATRLAADPAAATPRLCLAEFVRLNALDDAFLDTAPPADELAGTPSRFGGAPFSRLDTYRAVIDSPRTTAGERAYALFRAVRCYAPSRNNACGGEGVGPATRRGWFRRLHRDYPGSRWAADLDYYW